MIHVRIFDSAGYCENEWAEYMTNSKINMGILVSHNTRLDFVNITALVNNGPRSVYLHHIGTFQVYTSFGNNDSPDHLASYGANMIRTHTVNQPDNLFL